MCVLFFIFIVTSNYLGYDKRWGQEHDKYTKIVYNSKSIDCFERVEWHGLRSNELYEVGE